MKLYLLRWLNIHEKSIYDARTSLVIRAESEVEARRIANMSPADEGKVWGDPKDVTCEVLETDGLAKLIVIGTWGWDDD